MKLNVGDYVRTKHYGICKITDIYNEDKIELDKTNAFGIKGVCYSVENIIKSSPNIIDLIEVGDYVNGRIVDEFIYLDKLGLIGLSELEKEDEKLIKSIVTKEMYASVEYRVETN